MTGWLDADAWWDFIEPKLDAGRAVPIVAVIALVGGLIIATATEIGVRIFNTDWNYVAGYTAQGNRGWQPFFALWAIAAAGPIVQGLVSTMLMKFNSPPPVWLRGIAVAVIGMIPIYVASVTLFMLPGILIVAVAFLISCAWWGSGNRRLLGIRDGDSAEHVAVSLAISGAILLLLSASIPIRA
ncbi:MAG: hypothetical protein ACRECQ_00870 [Burkholderiaceae bacterium]